MVMGGSESSPLFAGITSRAPDAAQHVVMRCWAGAQITSFRK
ncbi:hypothetical protein ACVIIV_001431 [Bradyrhizobium sp. USDA 4354]